MYTTTYVDPDHAVSLDYRASDPAVPSARRTVAISDKCKKHGSRDRSRQVAKEVGHHIFRLAAVDPSTVDQLFNPVA